MIPSTTPFRVSSKGAFKRDTKFGKTQGDSVYEVSIERTKNAWNSYAKLSKTEGDAEHGPFPYVLKRSFQKGHKIGQNRG